jgi:hypothetical protein
VYRSTAGTGTKTWRRRRQILKSLQMRPTRSAPASALQTEVHISDRDLQSARGDVYVRCRHRCRRVRRAELQRSQLEKVSSLLFILFENTVCPTSFHNSCSRRLSRISVLYLSVPTCRCLPHLERLMSQGMKVAGSIERAARKDGSSSA